MEQIRTACELHGKLTRWRASEAALRRLKDTLPGFDFEPCLIKAAALDSLYGTNVRAVVQLAERTAEVIGKPNPERTDVALVEAISEPPGLKRKFTSFASKFCHFFVDEERFPVYDRAARRALRVHFGSHVRGADASWSYRKFCEAFFALAPATGPRVSFRDMDHYLWIVGEYWFWTRRSQPVNQELREAFEAPANRSILRALLPEPLRGEVKVA